MFDPPMDAFRAVDSIDTLDRNWLQQLWETLTLGNDAYMPHGQCYVWQTPLVGLHVASDALIAIAYFSIPILLLYFDRQRRNLIPFNVSGMFSVFIIACADDYVQDLLGYVALTSIRRRRMGLKRVPTA